jgi:hypothetical protein
MAGMISRAQFLDSMCKPFYPELYLRRPIRSLLHALNVQHLELPSTTGIHQAVRLALTRSADQLYEPIIVCYPDGRRRLLAPSCHRAAEGGGGIRQSGQERIPGQYEPRDPYTDEWCDWND